MVGDIRKGTVEDEVKDNPRIGDKGLESAQKTDHGVVGLVGNDNKAPRSASICPPCHGDYIPVFAPGGLFEDPSL